MAELKITLGPLTSSVTGTDVKFKKILDLIYEMVELPPVTGDPIVYTAQQRLDMTLQEIVKTMVRRAKERNYYKQRIASEETIAIDNTSLDIPTGT